MSFTSKSLDILLEVANCFYFFWRSKSLYFGLSFLNMTTVNCSFHGNTSGGKGRENYSLKLEVRHGWDSFHASSSVM